MRNTIAVFDSGIGSYSIVEKIRQAAQSQDIIYLADRQSFPYGSKNEKELFNVTSKAIAFLENNYHPAAIVVASNAPSVMVLPQLQSSHKTNLFGVFPPVKTALAQSKSKHIGILAVKSLVESPSIKKYIASQTADAENIHLINASDLVELVESGVFMRDKELTGKTISKFLGAELDENPHIDSFTLSSTHLPWLSPYFTELFPNHKFVDPADDVIAALPINSKGDGKTLGLVTTSKSYGIDEFKETLRNLGIAIDLAEVSFCNGRNFRS